MRLKKKNVEEAIKQLQKNGVKPPYKMWVQAPYENPYGIWRMGLVRIKGRNADHLWGMYKALWKRFRKKAW